MKRYGYHRTSTKEQHLDRGITEIKAYCSANNLELEKIFTDQQTGKNFNRLRYLIMKDDVLREGDELVVTEVDRLGRNKHETLKELQYYRDNGISVKILELPTTLMDLSAMDLEAFVDEYKKVMSGELRPFDLMRKLGISKAAYYRYVTKLENAK